MRPGGNQPFQVHMFHMEHRSPGGREFKNVPCGTLGLTQLAEKNSARLRPGNWKLLPPNSGKGGFQAGVGRGSGKQNDPSIRRCSLQRNPTRLSSFVDRSESHHCEPPLWGHIFHATVEHFCLERKAPNRLPKESGLLPLRLGQSDVNVGSADCDWDSRQASSRAEIQQSCSFRHNGKSLGAMNTFHEMPRNDFSGRTNRREIDFGIPLKKQGEISLKLV